MSTREGVGDHRDRGLFRRGLLRDGRGIEPPGRILEQPRLGVEDRAKFVDLADRGGARLLRPDRDDPAVRGDPQLPGRDQKHD
jgi:hypothetical protein